MTPLRQAASEAARSYMRSGGKTNRRKQRYLLFRFVDFCHENGTTTPDQLGQKTVVRYWKKHRDLSDRVLLNHFYAIATLWRFLDKPGDPPRPRPSIHRAQESDKMLKLNQPKTTTLRVSLTITEELNNRLEAVKSQAQSQGGDFDVETGLAEYLSKQIRKAEAELEKLTTKANTQDSPSNADARFSQGAVI